jgi:flavin reductase (DIM6/NTAB) family NADH-FMN oxidoreductase RutF
VATAPDQDAFREVVSRFASGVCVLTSRWGSHDHAATATAFMSVSLEPLLVAVSVHEDARILDAINDTGAWAVSLLSAEQRHVAQWLATPGRPVISQLDRVPHRRGTTGAALLEGALGAIEATTAAVHPAGDHALVLGAVVDVHLGTAGPPLLYANRSYATLS